MTLARRATHERVPLLYSTRLCVKAFKIFAVDKMQGHDDHKGGTPDSYREITM
ncbi:MAG TPA: hypothetical protein VK589_15160 [Chryseolinea sp.]|nr:hypothetical protein [Chryseolinea sp.]